MPAPRPRSVTLACLYAGFGAAFGFVSLVSLLGGWGSVEMQDQIGDVLSEPPLASSDLSVDYVLDVLRWVAMAGVVACIAAMVFAIFAFRGDRGSRLGLTVLCALAAAVFLMLGLYGIIPAMLAVTCIVLLWTRDARAYFSGEEPPVQLGAAPSVTEQPRPEHAVMTQQPLPSTPSLPSAPDRRPRSVVAALVITMVGSVLVAGLGGLTLLSVLVGRAELERSWEQPGLTRDLAQASGLSLDDMIRVMVAFAVGWLVLCLVGMIVAFWGLMSRSPAARIGLLVMTIVSLVVSLLFFPVGLPVSIAAVVVLVQLNKADARAWYRGNTPHIGSSFR